MECCRRSASTPSCALTGITPSWLPDGGAAEDAFPVARALLPAETDEGVRLRYSMLEYTVCG